MTAATRDEALQHLLDRAEIRDVVLRLARGVDRGDWDLARSCFHPDATDDHIDYRGGVDGFIEYAKGRLAGAKNSMHLIGNMLIEFAGTDRAVSETYYLAQRLRAPTGDELNRAGPRDAIAWLSWGRFLDRFERRNCEWRIAHREIALDTRFTAVAMNVSERGPTNWGTRDRSDPLYALQEQVRLLANAAG